LLHDFASLGARHDFASLGAADRVHEQGVIASMIFFRAGGGSRLATPPTTRHHHHRPVIVNTFNPPLGGAQPSCTFGTTVPKPSHTHTPSCPVTMDTSVVVCPPPPFSVDGKWRRATGGASGEGSASTRGEVALVPGHPQGGLVVLRSRPAGKAAGWEVALGPWYPRGALWSAFTTSGQGGTGKAAPSQGGATGPNCLTRLTRALANT
jgi:hypothetical protein